MNENKDLYTYAVWTPKSGEYYDEIDVYASSVAEADRLAREEADWAYGEDSTLKMITPGGSGGFVVAVSF